MAQQDPSKHTQHGPPPDAYTLPAVLDRRLPGTPAWAYRGRSFWDRYLDTPPQGQAA